VPGTAEHVGLVYWAWIKSMLALHRDLDPNWLAAAQNALISRILRHPSAAVLVATRRGAPEDWHGYLVATGDRVLHWVWVKRRFRQGGIATALLTAAFGMPDERQAIDATCATPNLGYLSAWPLTIRTHRLCEVSG